MIVASRRKGDDRQPCPVGSEQVKRVLGRRRMAEQQRALPQIIQHQAGVHEREPGKIDRLAPEMAHVGIQGLRSGHRQEDRAQREKGELRIDDEELAAQTGLSDPMISG